MLFILLKSLDSSAQPAGDRYSTALSYSWQINRQGPNVQPVLQLKNEASTDLKTGSWSIYFNSIKKPFLLEPDKESFSLTHINGDLFNLRPKPDMHPVGAKAEISLRISVPEIRNYTELPAGFYLVHDEKEGGILLKNTSIPFTGIEPEIALKSYLSNSQFIGSEKVPALIFPTPASISLKNGSYVLKQHFQIASVPAFVKEANLLASEFKDLIGKRPAVQLKKNNFTAISLEIGEMPPGGYSLECSTKGIVLKASEPSGIFYGIQSLKTLMPPDVWRKPLKEIELPAIMVNDAPRFEHRALLLDVARNFQSMEKIYKVLDLMALYKMNVLHFHLNDDEGWRVEIDGLPELTTVGARRGHSIAKHKMLPPSYGSGPSADNAFGTGFYSRSDYIKILRYATARHIAVIPEIESPGHARAAIKSMDARYERLMKKGDKHGAEEFLLRDLADTSVYRSVQGWNDNVINPALPSTYNFIKKVTSAFVKMHQEANAPLKTIHMGGDEVPEGVWTGSPKIRALMESNKNIEGVYGLWKYYFSRVNKILADQNLKLSGWEEVGLKKTLVAGKGKWIPDTTVSQNGYTLDVWNNIIGTGAEDLAYKLANRGFRVVLSNVTNNYLDMAYNSSFYEHGMNWAGFVNVDKPFYFNPSNYYLTTTENEYGHTVSQEVFKDKEKLTEPGKKNILGLQAALWTETIAADSLLDYMLLPKLLGAAERAWSKEPDWATITGPVLGSKTYRDSWRNFTSTIGLRELPRLDYYMGGYKYRIPEPGIEKKNGMISANVQIPGFTIRYTTDGSEPNRHSSVYSQPIPAKGTITLKVFNAEGRSGKKVTIHSD